MGRFQSTHARERIRHAAMLQLLGRGCHGTAQIQAGEERAAQRGRARPRRERRCHDQVPGKGRRHDGDHLRPVPQLFGALAAGQAIRRSRSAVVRVRHHAASDPSPDRYQGAAFENRAGRRALFRRVHLHDAPRGHVEDAPAGRPGSHHPRRRTFHPAVRRQGIVPGDHTGHGGFGGQPRAEDMRVRGQSFGLHQSVAFPGGGAGAGVGLGDRHGPGNMLAHPQRGAEAAPPGRPVSERRGRRPFRAEERGSAGSVPGQRRDPGARDPLVRGGDGGVRAAEEGRAGEQSEGIGGVGVHRAGHVGRRHRGRGHHPVGRAQDSHHDGGSDRHARRRTSDHGSGHEGGSFGVVQRRVGACCLDCTDGCHELLRLRARQARLDRVRGCHGIVRWTSTVPCLVIRK
mmetsp:Transcript_7821/g.48507  ORF Transcript_7821/g.48507 Transcript_7821/m.48507 type:complete len:401 (+) Transcript_7821:450-1652(+)